MTDANDPTSPIEDAAVDWFVRLQDPSADEAQFIAFRDWLEASADHRAAYDRVEQLWVKLETAPAPSAPALAPSFQPRRAAAARAEMRRMSVWGAGGAAMAAGLAAALILPQMATPHTDIYRTAKGQRLEVALADGSHLTLNSGSEVHVQLSHKRRQATLVTGEAMFDVVHDQARPFQAAIGDEQVRDIGTVFNLRQVDDQVTVTVLQGIVEVSPRAGGSTRLSQGDQLERRIGSTDTTPTRVNPEDAVSWRTGRLIYRDQPLSVVMTDLNRYLPTPITTDAKAGALRFSGVLQLDHEDVMIGRLQGLLPIRATSTPSGIRLTERN